ncbi:hypothetical protein B0H13DRAFT_1850871 [Mycena leptocephala]|nr:hypothetical protein B0H13DRAFT_1850871 [Mycena leptocephala]
MSILRDLAPTRSLRRERRVNEPWRDLHGSDLRLHRGRDRILTLGIRSGLSIGRQETTRSEMSRAAPGQPVYSSSQVFSLTHTGIAHLCLVPCTATLPRLPAHFPTPAASALAHALQVISVAVGAPASDRGLPIWWRQPVNGLGSILKHNCAGLPIAPHI